MAKNLRFKKEEKKPKGNLLPRSPIVTVVGHVDHGKTTLLDKIRKTNLAQKEPGEITQHIGASQVEVLGKKITFIDTPGHEAFVKLRRRGVSVTDLAILVVAADDGVKPQTLEAIAAIQEAKVPLVVALNKIDLSTADQPKVKKQLAKVGVLVEDLGGDVVCVPISAKTGQGIAELLEMILLLAEMAEIKADPQGPLQLAIIEGKLDRRRGPVATAIVQNGTLKVGQIITLEGEEQKVRALVNDRGVRVKEALPGMPVEILGFKKVPQIGAITTESKLSQEEKLKIILKADTFGSLEAIQASLPPQVQVIFSGVGEVSESDILLAKAIQATIVAFNLQILPLVKKLAEIERVKIIDKKIIYELLDAVAALFKEEGEIREEILGRAKIVAQFPFNKQRVAGCHVLEGRIARQDTVKLVREKEEVGKSRVKSLRQQKEDVSQVFAGAECGLLLEPPLDFQLGDMLISSRQKAD